MNGQLLTNTNISLFPDLIGALRNVVREVFSFPEERRKQCSKIFSLTFDDINTALIMVIVRLGVIRDLEDDFEFMREVRKLDNDDKWLQSERELRLCKKLRESLREMKTLGGQIDFKVSTKDWKFLLERMEEILPIERTLANYISSKFFDLSKFSRRLHGDKQAVKALRERVNAFRDALLSERNALMDLEIEMQESI